jgi:predicted flap endonuclease-1-like 5' DNA nuclease
MGIDSTVWLSITTIQNDYVPLYQSAERAEGAPWFLIWLLLLIGVAAVVISWAMNRAEEKMVPSQQSAAVAETEPVPGPVRTTEARPETVPEAPSEVADQAAPAAEEPPAAADDLTRIEGIGPKISGVLNEAGISTYDQLATTDEAHLQEILDAADLRLAHPATWPEQAKLAGVGDWESLDTFQDQLKGGRRAD